MKTEFSPVPLEVRGDVAYFAGLIEHRLRENDHKKGWSKCSLLWLSAKLSEEVGELNRDLIDLYASDGDPYGPDAEGKLNTIIAQAAWEAVDTAAVAMMLASQLTNKL